MGLQATPSLVITALNGLLHPATCTIILVLAMDLQARVGRNGLRQPGPPRLSIDHGFCAMSAYHNQCAQ